MRVQSRLTETTLRLIAPHLEDLSRWARARSAGISKMDIAALSGTLPQVVALALGSASRIIRGLNGRLRAVSSISGAMMVAAGAIMLLGIYQQFFTRITAAAPWIPWEPRL